MGILEDIGGKMEPFVEPPKTGNDEAIRELLESNKRLAELLAHKPTEQPKQEKPPKPKQAAILPPFSRAEKTFTVYLILPSNISHHTKIEKHGQLYRLELTKKVYTEDGFPNADKLREGISNVVLLKRDGTLAVGGIEFTPKAKLYIHRKDQTKMRDRAAENAVRTQDTKYLKIDGMNIFIAIVLISVGVFLVLWVLFGGLPGVVTAINAAPAAAKAVINNTVVNQTIVVG